MWPPIDILLRIVMLIWLLYIFSSLILLISHVQSSLSVHIGALVSSEMKWEEYTLRRLFLRMHTFKNLLWRFQIKIQMENSLGKTSVLRQRTWSPTPTPSWVYQHYVRPFNITIFQKGWQKGELWVNMIPKKVASYSSPVDYSSATLHKISSCRQNNQLTFSSWSF